MQDGDVSNFGTCGGYGAGDLFLQGCSEEIKTHKMLFYEKYISISFQLLATAGFSSISC